MKKFITVILAVALVVSLVGCSTEKPNKNEKPLIVCTMFPQYDWIANITKGFDCEIVLLAENAIDLHSFNPTAQDIVTIGKADVFVYNGGESDEWVDDVLKTVKNKEQKTINLIEVTSSRAITFDDDGETEVDEHAWLSIKNAEMFCNAFALLMAQKYPDSKDLFTQNRDAYIQSLKELDDRFAATEWNKTMILADRDPFRYLMSDYNIDCLAAYYGCSAEIEVSFSTIIELAKKCDELGVQYIYIIDGTDQLIALQILENVENKDIKMLQLQSMQSLTIHDIGNTTYIDIMKDNLAALQTGQK